MSRESWTAAEIATVERLEIELVAKQAELDAALRSLDDLLPLDATGERPDM